MFERIRQLFRRSESSNQDPYLQYGDRWKAFTTVSNLDASFKLGLPKEVNERTLAQSYAEIAWVHVAIKSIVESAAMLPLKIYEKRLNKGKYDKAEVTSGYQFDLINRPSEFTTPFELKQSIFGSYCYAGNAYLYVDTEDSNLVVLHPQDTKIVASKANFIEKYLFRPGFGEQLDLMPHQVVHVKSFNPTSYFYGLSPLEAAWRQVNYQDKEADFWNVFWKEGGRIQGAFFTDNPISKEDKEAMQEALKKSYGGVKNMQRNMILDNGLKYQQLGVSQKDAQIIERLRMTREDILAVYGVPPGIAGVLDQSNYSNMEVQERLFYKKAILPITKLIEQAMNSNLLLSENGRYTYEFDISEIDCLKANEELKAKIGRLLLDSGQMTANEVREMFWKMPRLSDGNVLKPLAQGSLGGGSFDQGVTGASVQSFIQKQIEAIDKELATIDVTPEKEMPVLNQPKKPLKSRLDPQKREAIAKNFDQELEKHDNVIKASMKEVFEAQKKLVLANLRKELKARGDVKLSGEADLARLMHGFDETKALAQKKLADAYLPVMKEFGEKAVKHLESLAAGKGLSNYQVKAADFNFNDPRVERFIKGRSVKIAGLTTDTTAQELRNNIGELFTLNSTIQEIADYVESYFDSIEPWRAATIARTETAAAANEAADNVWNQNSDVVQGREWITARDADVRDSHQIDGQTQGLNDPFILANGNLLFFPGESGGEPADVINCRCTTSPVTDFES